LQFYCKEPHCTLEVGRSISHLIKFVIIQKKKKWFLVVFPWLVFVCAFLGGAWGHLSLMAPFSLGFSGCGLCGWAVCMSFFLLVQVFLVVSIPIGNERFSVGKLGVPLFLMAPFHLAFLAVDYVDVLSSCRASFWCKFSRAKLTSASTCTATSSSLRVSPPPTTNFIMTPARKYSVWIDSVLFSLFTFQQMVISKPNSKQEYSESGSLYGGLGSAARTGISVALFLLFLSYFSLCAFLTLAAHQRSCHRPSLASLQSSSGLSGRSGHEALSFHALSLLLSLSPAL